MLRPGSVRKAQVAVIPETVLCDEHREKVNLFCTNCHNLVCTECVVDKHNGHTFKRLTDIAVGKRQELSEKLDNLESKTLPEIKKILAETRRIKTEHQKNGKDLTDNINKRADELISGVDEARKDLLRELNNLQEQDQAKLIEFEQKLDTFLSDAEETVVQYRTDLETSKEARTVKMVLELDTQLQMIELECKNIPAVTQLIFLPGCIGNLRGILGQCVEKGEVDKAKRKEPSQLSDHVIETKLEVVSEFQHETDKGEICAIASMDNQSAWIATYDGTSIKHVNKTGQVDKTLTLTTQIADLAITDDSSVIVVPNGGSGDHPYQVKKVKINGDIVTFIDTKPLCPSCICTSQSGNIYIGCVDGYNYDVTDKNTRSVIKLSRDGVKLKTWQFNERHERIFTLPSKVQTNINNDTWVSDRTDRTSGRVVVLHDQKEGVRFIYKGVKNDKITRNFNPNDLTAADDETMLIGDLNNHIIHVVDENGVLLYFLGSQYKTGLGAVTAICLNRKNSLWVGDLKGHVQVLRLK